VRSRLGIAEVEPKLSMATTFVLSRTDLRAVKSSARGIFLTSQLSDSQLSQKAEAPDRKEIFPMHDFLVACAFLLMVILPCIVTMGSGTAEEDSD